MTKKMWEGKKNLVLIDDCFWVWETRFGLWSTHTKEDVNPQYGSTGLTRDDVVKMTRWTLKHHQEGDLHLYTRVVGSSTVSGKL